MKFRSLLLTLGCVARAEVAEPESRFGLVISTLEDIVKNVDNQSAREKTAFDKFQAWCTEEITGLSTGAEKAKANSEKAFVNLRELTASISTLEHGLASLSADVKELQDAQDQINTIREEETSKYAEEVELNTQSAQTVSSALSKVSSSKSAFLQRQSLEPDSGYVVGLLRGIQERLNQTRSELDQTEEAKSKTHSTLARAKKEQESLLQAEVLEKQRLLQQAKLELVEAQRIYDEEQESSEAMTKMKAETKDKCYMKTIEYSMRKEDQQKEREAIASAVTTLKQEESGGKNAAGATSFLQMNSAHKTRSDDKRDTVRNAVALMQHQTRAKAAGMGKAAEAVLGLIDAIKSHQAEDSKRKRFCEAQLGSNEDAKAKLQGELTRLKARQDFLGSEVGTLGTQVEDLKKEAQDFTDRLSKLEEVRSKEKESYDASSRDRALTIKVVKKAKAILEGFYDSKDATALAEVNASPKQAPDTWQLGSSRNGNLGSSVIAMLDTIVWDFQKEQSDAEKAEENAEAELEKVREDTKTLFDKKLEHVSKLLQEKARDAQELSQVKADVELKGTSLAATEDTLAKLGEDCTQLLAGFDKTLADRQKQIYQLKDVAEILGGATVGTRTGVRAGLLELQSLRP